eukprot:7483197-Ditylum_brightwellii.AAC.1
MQNMTKAKQNPPPISKYAKVSLQIVEKAFLNYINFQSFKVDNRFNYKQYLMEVKCCSHYYKNTFLANKNEEPKELNCSNVKSGDFLSFFVNEFDDDITILCTEHKIEKYIKYCKGTNT